MPIVSTFDGPNRRITLDIANIIPVQGIPTATVDVPTLYSEIVDWQNGDTAGDPNSRWIQPVRAIGGDQTAESQRAGTRVFFMNDWEIIPADTSHTLILEGAIALDFDTNTSGKFIDFSSLQTTSRVSVTYQQPDLTTIVETSAGGGGSGAGDATLANQIEILNNLLLMAGSGFDTNTHSLVQIIAAIAGLPSPSDATLSNQSAILDILALLGYSPGNAVTTVETASGNITTASITTGDGKNVDVVESKLGSTTTTTITRNDL